MEKQITNGTLTINGAKVACDGLTLTVNFVEPAAQRVDFTALHRACVAFGRAALTMLPSMEQLGRAMERVHRDVFLGRAYDIDGGIVYVGDAAGRVRVGGYVEDLDWLHGLLRLRYGPECVTDITGNCFIFRQAMAVRRSPRWMMYCSIP